MTKKFKNYFKAIDYMKKNSRYSLEFLELLKGFIF